MMNGLTNVSYVWDLIRVFLALGAVIIIILFAHRWLGKLMMGKNSIAGQGNQDLEVRQRIPLGVKKQLLVASIRGQLILLAVNEQDVQLLKTFPEQKGESFSLMKEGAPDEE